MLFFTWLRSRVKNAVLGGLTDAIDLLEQGEDVGNEDAGPQLLLRLRLAVTPALPSADEDEAPASKRKKA